MRNKLLIAFLPLTVWAQTANNFATMYGSAVPSGLQSAVANYIGPRFPSVILTFPNVPTGQTSKWFNYTEGTFLVPNDSSSLTLPSAMYLLRDNVVIPNSYSLESMFMHHSVDFMYGTTINPTNTEIGCDQFDAWETTAGGTKINGVFTYNGSYADVTVNSYAGGSITVASTLYAGFPFPFDQMNFAITTARVAGTVAYNYWNGTAWTSLAALDPVRGTANLQSDGTSGLTATGQVYFYPPSDWSITTVNGSKSKYWIQTVITGQSTNPVYHTLKGDNWEVASSGTNTRGWDPTNASGHQINIGTPLVYDPAPPTNSTAKFPSQGRVPAAGYQLYQIHNDSYIVGGVRAWSKWLVYKAANNYCVVAGQCGGIMFDDAAYIVGQSISAPANPTSYLDYNQSSTQYLERQAMYSQAVPAIHAALGSGFVVVGNSIYSPVSYIFDRAYSESNRYTTYATGCLSCVAGVPTTGTHDIYAYPDPQGFGHDTYDTYLTANNPGGTQDYMMWFDLPSPAIYPGNFGNSNWHGWDRGQRGPIGALAAHFIGQNAKTGFVYFNDGNSFLYSDTDDIYTYATPTTLTASIGPVGAGSNTIQLASTANCPTGSLNAYVSLTGRTFEGGETLQGTVSGSNITTTAAIYNTHNSGDLAYCVTPQRQSQLSSVTPTANVYRYGQWFPARSVNIGIPDTAGLNGGARIEPWKFGGTPDFISGQGSTACNSNNHCPNVYRRDYTKAIVLWREYQYGMIEGEWDTPSTALALGGTYYPLNSDGTTGAGISSITLRASEGAILMKSPLPAPSGTGGLFPLPMPVGTGTVATLRLLTLTNAQLLTLTNAQLSTLGN